MVLQIQNLQGTVRDGKWFVYKFCYPDSNKPTIKGHFLQTNEENQKWTGVLANNEKLFLRWWCCWILVSAGMQCFQVTWQDVMCVQGSGKRGGREWIGSGCELEAGLTGRSLSSSLFPVWTFFIFFKANIFMGTAYFSYLNYEQILCGSVNYVQNLSYTYFLNTILMFKSLYLGAGEMA